MQLVWNDVARFVESFVTGMLLAVRSSYIANPSNSSIGDGEVLYLAPVYSVAPPTNGYGHTYIENATMNSTRSSRSENVTDVFPPTYSGSQSSVPTIGLSVPSVRMSSRT